MDVDGFPGIDPRKTACLLAAADEGTLRGAAARLALDPSTISRQIASLETLFGIALIERGRSGIRLTEAGESLVCWLRRQAGELEALRSDLDALRGMRRGRVSIAVGEGFIADLIGSALKGFAARHDGIGYTLHTGTSEAVVHAVTTDEAHLGLAYNPAPSARTRTLARTRQPLVMLAASDSPFVAAPAPLDLATLATFPCAVLTHGSGIGAVLERVEARHGLRFRATVETQSIPVLKNYVREGLGVTFLPRFVVARELLDGHIVGRDVDVPEFAEGEAHLLTRRGRRLPEVARVLAEYLMQAMVAFRVEPDVDREAVVQPAQR